MLVSRLLSVAPAGLGEPRHLPPLERAVRFSASGKLCRCHLAELNQEAESLREYPQFVTGYAGSQSDVCHEVCLALKTAERLFRGLALAQMSVAGNFVHEVLLVAHRPLHVSK